MTGPEGAMPRKTIEFVNRTLAGLGKEVSAAVHVPMTETGQQLPADDGLYTAFRKSPPPETACDLPEPLYDPRHRMIIEGSCGSSSDGIAVSEMNESGPHSVVPGSDFQVDPAALSRIVALYRGENPSA